MDTALEFVRDVDGHPVDYGRPYRLPRTLLFLGPQQPAPLVVEFRDPNGRRTGPVPLHSRAHLYVPLTGHCLGRDYYAADTYSADDYVLEPADFSVERCDRDPRAGLLLEHIEGERDAWVATVRRGGAPCLGRADGAPGRPMAFVPVRKPGPRPGF